MIGRLRTHLQIIMKSTSNFKYFICKKINYKFFFDDFYVKYFLYNKNLYNDKKLKYLNISKTSKKLKIY